MKLGFPALLLSLAMAFPLAPAHAEKEVKQLKSRDLADQTSGKAYIVYKTVEDKFDVYFLRSLTAPELESFSENRAEALAEERAKLRKRREGAPDVSDEELLPSAAFTFVDDDINNLVRMDSGRVYRKDGRERTYVVEVPPGEYTIYAAGIDGFRGGTCMCMGTVRFQADAGQITNLGAILVAHEDGKTDIPELEPYEAPEYIRRKALPYIMTVRPAAADDQVPEAFSELTVVTADYRASDKIPNFMGMLINRMVPIDGVLDYELDNPVDVKGEIAGQGVAAQEQEAAEAAVAATATEAEEAEAASEDASAAEEAPVE